MKKHCILVGLLLGALVATMLVGCGKKVSKENYDKIQVGMTVAEVEDILGKGEKESAGAEVGGIELTGQVYVWKDGEKKVTVTFKDGKAVGMTQSGL